MAIDVKGYALSKKYTKETLEGSGAIQGKPGVDGATFTPSIDENGTLSWTNNKNLPNPSPVKVKGEAGQNGITPHIDPDTKHWIIGNEDTNIVASSTDYSKLENKPQLNSVQLSGNKSIEDIGIVPLSNAEILNIISQVN